MPAEDHLGLAATSQWVGSASVETARSAGATVTSVTATVVSTSLESPILTANYQASEMFHTLVRVETAGGGRGYGHTFAFSRARAEIIRSMVEDVAERLVGRADVADPGGTWLGMCDDIAFLGTSGVSLIAVSAIDTAIWDAFGHLADRPVHRLLGGEIADVECYASDRLWLGESHDELVQDVRAFVEAGFGAVKLRIGTGDDDHDRARVDAVLRALPDGIDLMVDANQAWSREQAGRMLEKLADVGLRWLEEPVRAADVTGLASICERAGMPIAGGESWYGPDQAVPAIDASGLDVFMPDLQRMGGVTGWLVSASAARSAGMVVSPHLFPEVQVSLMCGLGVQGPIEYVPWYRPLFAEAPDPVAGRLRPLETPGFGLTPARGIFE